jgi:hypothetical protein
MHFEAVSEGHSINLSEAKVDKILKLKQAERSISELSFGVEEHRAIG